MSLFNINSGLFEKDSNTIKIPSFDTPLGVVKLDISELENSFSNFTIDNFKSTKGAKLSILRNDNYLIEVLCFDPKTKGINLELTNYCWLIRIEKLSDKDITLKLKCELFTTLEKIKHGSGHGQGVEEKSFDNSRFRLSIGTEDVDCFFSRSEYNNWLPKRLIEGLVEFDASLFNSNLNFVEILDTGLQINIPLLFKGEKVQFNFLSSYSISSLYNYDYPEILLEEPNIDTYYGVTAGQKYLINNLISEGILNS